MFNQYNKRINTLLFLCILRLTFLVHNKLSVELASFWEFSRTALQHLFGGKDAVLSAFVFLYIRFTEIRELNFKNNNHFSKIASLKESDLVESVKRPDPKNSVRRRRARFRWCRSATLAAHYHSSAFKRWRTMSRTASLPLALLATVGSGKSIVFSECFLI